MLEAALDDLKVIDLTHYIAGPYATKLLADYGADVIKVERPGTGDGARRLGPFPGDDTDIEKSALFLHLNANKRSMTLDLKHPRGIEVLKEMVRQADVLVESFRPKVMPSLGLAYDVLSAINPALVMVSISDFGQTGPYRDYKGSEIVDYAIGGPMYVTGVEDRPPLKLGGNAVQYLAGIHAAGAAVVAIVGATLRGYGDHVDISIAETQAGSPDRRTPMIIGHQFTGEVWRRGAGFAPPVRPCKDGYMNIQTGIRSMDRFSVMVGRPELAEDPRFADPIEARKPENAAALEEILMGWLMERTMAEAWDAAQKARAASGPIYTMADILKDEHLQARGYWEEIDHPDAGLLRYPGLPFKTPGEARQPRTPAPRLGEHTEQVLAAFGYDASAVSGLRVDGAI